MSTVCILWCTISVSISDIFTTLYSLTDLTSEKQRRTLYHQETEQMARTAEALMEDVSNMHITFVQATHIELGPCLR